MKVLFWNVRGPRNVGRRKLVAVIRRQKIEVVCLQETIRQQFHERELSSYYAGRDFYWF